MENDTGALVPVMIHTEYKRLCNQKMESHYMQQE